jgi:hypothetical protein
MESEHEKLALCEIVRRKLLEIDDIAVQALELYDLWQREGRLSSTWPRTNVMLELFIWLGECVDGFGPDQARCVFTLGITTLPWR